MTSDLKNSDVVISIVQERIDELELTSQEASREIGITNTSLTRHLSGEHVRSDSLAKYRRWLCRDGDQPPSKPQQSGNGANQLELFDAETEALSSTSLFQGEFASQQPFYIVDLFSGCGGMSLGFDLYGQGETFQTVLAVDNELSMVTAYNANYHCRSGMRSSPGRQIDITEFLNECEVLAFYLDHAANVHGDEELKRSLEAEIDLEPFRSAIAGNDERFVQRLVEIRAGSSFKAGFSNLRRDVLNQTSVGGFHDELKLPRTGTKMLELPPLLWSSTPGSDLGLSQRDDDPDFEADALLLDEEKVVAAELWAAAVDSLVRKRSGSGRGQLTSSSRRIAEFLDFLALPVMDQVREAWSEWHASRQAARRTLFELQAEHDQLRGLYQASYPVSVLLGGPPCQGFSRIGRGKIRSLRESRVHVQEDESAGDDRNLLLNQYVLFVGALAPPVFIFENVQHFQSEVRTPSGTFRAPEVLAEAIEAISNQHLTYDVNSRILDCSKHGIPQTRRRFFMCGIRQDVRAVSPVRDVARWCLSVPVSDHVPLRTALSGLPAPSWLGGRSRKTGGLSDRVDVSVYEHGSEEGASGRYLAWIRQPSPKTGEDGMSGTDAHHGREPRSDDAAFFSLLGPGKRWMDYRCDDAETLLQMRDVISRLIEVVDAAIDEVLPPSVSEKLRQVSPDELQALLSKLDGSLSIRLLLEGIPSLPGELEHHLLSKTYLGKRDGNHGDWLARMDGEAPSKTIVSHMAKDTYAYVHPYEPRTISVREAARIQSFPDWFTLGDLGLIDAFRVIGNAVPPFLSYQLAERVVQLLALVSERNSSSDDEVQQVTAS